MPKSVTAHASTVIPPYRPSTVIPPYRPPNPKVLLELAPLLQGRAVAPEWRALALLAGGNAFAFAAMRKGLSHSRKAEFESAANKYFDLSLSLAHRLPG